jgi:cysteine desulfurase
MIDLARKRIADMLECKTDEIIFTSGGTESINYALKVYFNNPLKMDDPF